MPSAAEPLASLDMHSNEKTPPVNDVSKSSRWKCKQKHRHGCRNLNKRNQEWIGRQSGHEPAGSSVLHPHADIGNDGCELAVSFQ